ncbi:hypothetical protein HYH02_003950 [Chlamydomonas schloesseri]|uniref:Rhodanese domain-containing protein n=1 Tax=Chlamydomonas schloesseri TaxID=2026947 RepID=A0A835WPQ9_9CHLO|nr:hypothetical protein HYH02_003950 [Chlamydomonas schloesseri]|eukprot:KAG2451346.1 hypothetical protein HYH02_003950 [Chlamydomonas schloesseri]
MQLANAPRLAARPARSGVKVFAQQRTQAKTAVPKTLAAGLVASSVLLQASAARADELDTTVESVIGAVKATGEVVKTGITAIQTGVKVLKDGYDVAAPIAREVVDTVAPVVVEAAKKTVELASPAIEAAAPAITNTVSDVLESTGVDLSAVSKTAGTVGDVAGSAVSVATPVARGLVDLLAASDPVTLGEYALGAVALYYISPLFFGAFRGYAGDMTAAVALDTVVNDPSSVLIDIRAIREKEASGVPDVPGGASSKVLEVEFAALEDKKLRSQLKNPQDIEAQTTALQIASLRRINSSTKVILLDRYGALAEAVARELAKKGYGKVYVVVGGFDGRNGWIQSKLQIKPYTATALTFSAPAFGRTGTTSTRRLPAPRS